MLRQKSDTYRGSKSSGGEGAITRLKSAHLHVKSMK